MPLIFRDRGHRFHFYSNEGEPREPVHVHVVKDGADAKFWLRPDVAVAYNKGFNASALSLLLGIVQDRRAEIEKAWHEHFG